MFRSHALILFSVFFSALSAHASELGLPGNTVPSGFGVNIHFTDPLPGEMERFGEAGYRVARMDLSWSAVERQRGEYDFAAYDRLVAHLASVGARPLFILDYGNPMYDDGRAPHTEAGRSAFARFAAAAAGHLRGKCVMWEIWNEPNLAQFWKPEPNAIDYVKLAIAASKAVHGADPHAIVLAPGSSGFSWEFFESIFRAGLLAHIDAVSVHPYRSGPPESAVDDFGRLRCLIARYAPPEKRSMPLVSSEWGYSTAEGGLSETSQAEFLARMWLVNLASGVNLSIFYDWRDDGDDPRENEFRFGTVRRDFRPKPSFLAAKSLTTDLNGFSFRHRIRGHGTDDWQLLFQRGDTQELALVTWNAGASAPDRQQTPSVRKIGSGDPTFASLYRLASVRFLAGALTEATSRAAEIDVTVVRSRHLQGAVTLVAGEASVPVSSPAGRTTTRRVVLSMPDARDERREVPVSLRSAGESFPPLAPWTVWRVDPVLLGAAPRGGELVVTIENPARVPLQGALSVESEADGSAPALASVEIREGDDRASVLVPRPNAGHRLVLKDAKQRAVATVPLRRYEPMAGFPMKAGRASGYEVVRFVENKPTPATWLQAVPLGSSAPLQVALSVPYHFDRGWRYAEVVPSGSARVPNGALALTFWAKSTAEKDHLRSRFRDTTGQTFQLDLGRLGWTGWRPVTVPLDGSRSGAHWGGAGDGVSHGPFTWEGLLLIDSARRDQPHGGEILIASPFYVFAK